MKKEEVNNYQNFDKLAEGIKIELKNGGVEVAFHELLEESINRIALDIIMFHSLFGIDLEFRIKPKETNEPS